MQFIRSTRADPPSLAGSNAERRAIYGAALEQFQQLRTAASVVTAAARPLPMFYALSQASRAVVAARGEVPTIDGHGLSEYRYKLDEDAPGDVLLRKISRTPKDHRDKAGKVPAEDGFGALARATGSADIKGTVELGALWASLPLATAVPDGPWREEWRPSVGVSLAEPVPGEAAVVPPGALFVSIAGHPTIKVSEGIEPSRYPDFPAGLQIHDARPDSLQRPQAWSGIGIGAGIYPFVQSVPRVTRFSDERALMPTLPGQEARLSHLMTWWALLFGLSVFARYHPDLWLRSLDPDHSATGVPLETLLEQAIDQIPELVYGELYPDDVGA